MSALKETLKEKLEDINGGVMVLTISQFMDEEKGQCPECGCKMESVMCNECGYMEEATFTDKHDDDGFQGAVGTVVVGLTQEQVDYIYSNECLLERWYDAFNPDGDKTEEEFLEEINNEINWGDFVPFEQHYDDEELLTLQYSKDNNFVAFEYIGGGRCFKEDQTFEEVYNEELLQEILKYEGEKG